MASPMREEEFPAAAEVVEPTAGKKKKQPKTYARKLQDLARARGLTGFLASTMPMLVDPQPRDARKARLSRIPKGVKAKKKLVGTSGPQVTADLNGHKIPAGTDVGTEVEEADLGIDPQPVATTDTPTVGMASATPAAAVKAATAAKAAAPAPAPPAAAVPTPAAASPAASEGAAAATPKATPPSVATKSPAAVLASPNDPDSEVGRLRIENALLKERVDDLTEGKQSYKGVLRDGEPSVLIKPLTKETLRRLAALKKMTESRDLSHKHHVKGTDTLKQNLPAATE